MFAALLQCSTTQRQNVSKIFAFVCVEKCHELIVVFVVFIVAAVYATVVFVVVADATTTVVVAVTVAVVPVAFAA